MFSALVITQNLFQINGARKRNRDQSAGRRQALMESVQYPLFLIFICFSPLRDDFNIKVLLAFVDLHEFADLNLVQALR